MQEACTLTLPGQQVTALPQMLQSQDLVFERLP